MIGFIRGILAEKGDGYVVIDVGGVGYEVSVPLNSPAYLNTQGSEIMVYTMMAVREDDVSLYGFSRKGELDAFKKLISVNGVGAKAGLSILSSFTLEQLKEAIVFEDAKSLTRANGIGKKIAERIVLELKDKFSSPGEAYQDSGKEGNGADIRKQDARSEAAEALVSLGYTRGEAMGALSGIRDDTYTAEDYIKAALKNLV